MDVEISLVSENYGIEAKNDDVKETVQWDKGGKYLVSAVGGIRDNCCIDTCPSC